MQAHVLNISIRFLFILEKDMMYQIKCLVELNVTMLHPPTFVTNTQQSLSLRNDAGACVMKSSTVLI